MILYNIKYIYIYQTTTRKKKKDEEKNEEEEMLAGWWNINGIIYIFPINHWKLWKKKNKNQPISNI